MVKNAGNQSRWKSARLRLATVAVAGIFAAGLFTAGMLAFGQLSAPTWIKRIAEDRIADAAGGRPVDLGRILLSFDLAGFTPLITVTDAELSAAAGLTGIKMTGMRIALDPGQALSGTFKIQSVAVESMFISAEIGAASADSILSSRSGAVPFEKTALRGISAFMAGAASAFEAVELENIEASVKVRDTGRTVRLTGGRFKASKGTAGIDASGRIAWETNRSADAVITAVLTSPPDSNALRLELEVTGVELGDLEAFAVLPDWVRKTDLQIQTRLVMQSDPSETLRRVEWQAEAASPREITQGDDGSFQLQRFEADGDYHLESGRLTLRGLHFVSSAGQTAGAGYLDIAAGTDGIPFAAGRLEFRDGRVGDWKWLPPGISDVSAQADFRFNLQTAALDIAQLSVQAEEAAMQARGRIFPAESGWSAAAEFSFENLDRDALIALWPENRAGAWLEERLTAGRAFSGAGGIIADPGQDTEISVNFQFEEVKLEFISGFPALTGAAGFGVLEGRSFAMRLDEGTIDTGNENRADVAGTEITLDGIFGDTLTAAVDLSLESRVGPLLVLLNNPPLNLIPQMRIAADLATGDVSAAGSFEFPVKSGLTIKDIGFSVEADVRSVTSRGIEGSRFESELVEVAVDNEGVSAAADGKFRGIPVSGKWQHEFSDRAIVEPITGTVELTADVIEEFGISLPPGSFSEAQTADFYLTFSQDGRPEFGITADARSLAFAVPGLPAGKAAGDAAQVVLEGQLGNPVELHRVSIAGESYEMEGAVKFSRDGRVESAEFSQARFGDWLDASVVYAAEGEYPVVITGGTVDLAKASAARLENQKFGTLNKPLRVKFDEVRLLSDTSLTDVSGTVVVDREIRGDFIAKMNGQTDVRVSINAGDSGFSMNFRSEDAGSLLRSAGILDNFYGGDMTLLVFAADDGKRLNMRVRITDVRVQRMPVLGELLNMASIIGVLQQLNGNGILFSEVQADILADRDQVEFRRAFASGLTLGMTAEGTIKRGNGELDLKGVITPLNTANEILMLTPLRVIGLDKGDGLGAVSYFIRGPADNPDVGANPLSVLTPGLFKNIFQ